MAFEGCDCSDVDIFYGEKKKDLFATSHEQGTKLTHHSKFSQARPQHERELSAAISAFCSPLGRRGALHGVIRSQSTRRLACPIHLPLAGHGTAAVLATYVSQPLDPAGSTTPRYKLTRSLATRL